MRLKLSRFIESDLDDIANEIAQDSPRRAVTFIQDIRAKFHEIRHNRYFINPAPASGMRRHDDRWQLRHPLSS